MFLKFSFMMFLVMFVFFFKVYSMFYLVVFFEILGLVNSVIFLFVMKGGMLVFYVFLTFIVVEAALKFSLLVVFSRKLGSDLMFLK